MKHGSDAHVDGSSALVSSLAYARANKNLDRASSSQDRCCGQQTVELGETDINKAVELSVAASEALVIHELVKSELEAPSVLEAALRMGKVRQECVCCTIDYPSEEADQSDSVSDFDDSVMLDAFQDVGLFCSKQEGDPIYHASLYMGKDFTKLDSCKNGCETGDDSVDILVQENDGTLSSSGTNYSPRGVLDPVLQEESEDISQFTPPKKENAAFPADLRHGNEKGIFVEPLIRETSFFSESKDVAPDECSLVQKRKAGCSLAPQSSVHFDGFCDRANELASGLLEAGSSDLSLVDPLCSVVPCSISPEDEIPFLGPVQNNTCATIAETCFGSLGGRCEDLVESFERDRQALPPVVSGHPLPSVQRKSVSMKNYSRHIPRNCTSTCIDEENLPAMLPMQPISMHPPARENNENQKDPKENSGLLVGKDTLVRLHSHRSLLEVQSECENLTNAEVQERKWVCFSSDIEVKPHQEKVSQKQQGSKRTKYSHTPVSDKYLASYHRNRKIFVFQGAEFLLTGFSNRKEKEMKQLICKHGGVVLWDIPSPLSISRRRRNSKSTLRMLPIILCSKKLQTTKFLYGCAVNTFILKPKWLTDSISAGSTMPPEKYMILPNQPKVRRTRFGKPFCCGEMKRLFDGVGFMLCGKRKFCTQFAIIIEHGGGHIFRSLHSLVQSIDSKKICVGSIISEDERRMSRHLRQCALESQIHVLPASLMVKSLCMGRLILTRVYENASPTKPIGEPLPASPECSQCP